MGFKSRFEYLSSFQMSSGNWLNRRDLFTPGRIILKLNLVSVNNQNGEGKVKHKIGDSEVTN